MLAEDVVALVVGGAVSPDTASVVSAYGPVDPPFEVGRCKAGCSVAD